MSYLGHASRCYTGDLLPIVSCAGEWFLRSGIQSRDGGVARFYRVDLAHNHAASTEITGYSVSTLVFLHSLTQDSRYLDHACAAARFLVSAWDVTSRSMPFEVGPASFSYFFDCGIIVRGLLACWRATGDSEFLEYARKIGDSMAVDFAAPDGQFHPILTLPDKRPVDRDPLRWSRSPGCYQLKSGLAWYELWEVTEEDRYRQSYHALLSHAGANAPGFLPGHAEPRKVVDRLHAFLYFLEGLLPVADEPTFRRTLRDGIESVASLLRELAAEFERSDVYAQLLRIRLYAFGMGAVPLDWDAARWEAQRLTEFAASSDDLRIDGGFYFGRVGHTSACPFEPYVNPVSTAFALQALTLWENPAQTLGTSLI